jgi:signal transduction histidine kinase/integral membrane sensor domain MASE1
VNPVSKWRSLLIGGLIFAVYYALGKLGLQLATINRSTSPIWPASGAAIAFLSIFGRRYWPAVALGAFVVNFQTHIPPLGILAITLGNTLEGLFGSLLLDRIARRSRGLFGAETFLAIFSAAILAPLISATLATGSLYLVAAIGRSQIVANWITWWVGDALGVLILAPYLFRVFGLPIKDRIPSGRGLGFALLSAGVVGIVFGANAPMVLLFLVYPVLTMAVWILRPVESAFAQIVISAAAVWGTLHGYGPFNIGSTNDNLICLALFLASLAITEQGLRFIKETGNSRLSLGILFAGWVLGAMILQGFLQNEAMIDQTRFQKLVDGTMAQYRQRAFLYESALRGAVGFFQAAPRVTPREWHHFVENIDIDRNYPGLFGVGYVLIVPEAGRKAFVRKMEAEGNPGFEIHPVKQAGALPPAAAENIHFVITAVEPERRNIGAVGLDIATEKNRYAGAVRAARTGRAVVTRPIRLVQDAQGRTGLDLFLPIFRDKKPIGWIYAPLIIDEFLANAGQSNSGEIAFELFFDDDSPGKKPLFTNVDRAENRAHRETIRVERTLWGQPAIFRWYRTATFQSRHDTTSAWVIFACVLLNILLCAFIAILESLNRRANDLALRLAGEIRTQQEKLEHSSRLAALGKMAGGIAHEINNPLAILSGRALLLSRLADEGDLNPDAVRKNSDKIRETVERMAKIINGLRTFSRNGKKDPFQPIALGKILSSTVDLCAERFQKEQVELQVETPPETELVCREVQVVQVLLNLLNNALDAVHPLSERWVSLAVKILPKEVQFLVTDSGHGIPAHVAHDMMSPFFTTKTVGAGTGLGLSISNGIAEDHAGALRYDPESSRTRFIFSISRGLSTG